MNNKITWIIENYAKESSYTELRDAIKESNHDLIEIAGDFKYEILDKFKPRTNGHGDIEDYGDRKCIMFAGSIELSKMIYDYLRDYAAPIIYCDFDKYKCSQYYSYFGDYLFNDRYVLVSLADFVRNQFFFYNTFGKEALVFIRPDTGGKEFQAQLLDLIDVDRFYENNKHLQHNLVLVSTPKTIRGEYRFVVSKDKIITHSTYRYQGQVCKIPAVPNGAKILVDNLLKIDYKPDSVFCYDVFEDTDENFYLGEITSFSSAGLYKCDKKAIVEEVSKIALTDYYKRFTIISEN